MLSGSGVKDADIQKHINPTADHFLHLGMFKGS